MGVNLSVFHFSVGEKRVLVGVNSLDLTNFSLENGNVFAKYSWKNEILAWILGFLLGFLLINP